MARTVVTLACALFFACSATEKPRPDVRGSTEAAAALRPDFQGPLVDGLARAKVGERWGFVDGQGAVVIEPRFDWAESFAGGRAAVARGGLWGFIDHAGAIVVPLTYLDADPYSEGVAAVRTASGWMYVDGKGTVALQGPFVAARPFACGRARVQVARAFLVGDRAHGDYEEVLQHDAEFHHAYEEQTLTALRARAALHRPDEAATATRAPEPREAAPGSHVDEVALARLYELERGRGLGSDNGQWGLLRGLKIEAQWEEDAWQVIDRSGHVVPPALVTACDRDAQGGRVRSPPQVPADLAATIGRLHTLRDRTAVFRQFYELGPAAVPGLVVALANKNQRVRLNALEILARMGPQAAAAVPAVSARLGDPDETFYATWVLGRMGPAAASAAPGLLEVFARRPALVEAALKDIGDGVTPALLAALATARPPADAELVLLAGAVGAPNDASLEAAIERAFHDPRPDLKASAALALVRRRARRDGGAEREAGIDAALLAGLEDARFVPKQSALEALGLEARRSTEGRAVLLRLAEHGSERDLSLAAASALAAIGDVTVAPVLVRLLDSKDVDAALSDFERLGTAGRALGREPVRQQFARTATPERDASLFADEAPRCRTHDLAARALVAMGDDDDDTVLADVKSQLSPDGSLPPDVLRTGPHTCDTGALVVLFELGPRGARAAPWLVRYEQAHATDASVELREAIRDVRAAIGTKEGG